MIRNLEVVQGLALARFVSTELLTGLPEVGRGLQKLVLENLGF